MDIATLSLSPGALAGAAPLRIARISEHASPLAAPGSIGCGGQNVSMLPACPTARSRHVSRTAA